MNKFSLKIKTFSILLIFIIFLNSCTSDKEKSEEKKFESNAYNRARDYADKNPMTLFGKDKDKNTNFEFSSSNILWRASLKVLDFIPLANVDYSGGIIITDWYSDGKSNKEQIKIQIKFTSSELRSESLQITSYKKLCDSNSLCTNIKGNENFDKEIKDLIINTARKIKIEENKKDKS